MPCLCHYAKIFKGYHTSRSLKKYSGQPPVLTHGTRDATAPRPRRCPRRLRLVIVPCRTLARPGRPRRRRELRGPLYFFSELLDVVAELEKAQQRQRDDLYDEDPTEGAAELRFGWCSMRIGLRHERARDGGRSNVPSLGDLRKRAGRNRELRLGWNRCPHERSSAWTPHGSDERWTPLDVCPASSCWRSVAWHRSAPKKSSRIPVATVFVLDTIADYGAEGVSRSTASASSRSPTSGTQFGDSLPTAGSRSTPMASTDRRAMRSGRGAISTSPGSMATTARASPEPVTWRCTWTRA